MAGKPALQNRWPLAPLYAWMKSEADQLALASPLPRVAVQRARPDSASALAATPNVSAANRAQSAQDSSKQNILVAPAAPDSRRGIFPLVNNNGRRIRETTKPIARVGSANAKQLPASMVFIKDTTYQRGDVFGDGAANEKPVHTVRVKSFYISAHEVTNEEYLAFVEATQGNLPEWRDSTSKYYYLEGADSFYKKLGPALYDPKHPVIGVSWTDAMKYCAWLSRRGPWRYRLPTEAEWELAARSGNSRNKFSWGEGAPQREHGGNVADEALKQVMPNLSMIWRAYNDTYIYTAPVAQFGANAFGLYDMTGNVWEWCLDWYAAEAYQKRESVNPQGPANGVEKAIRGGSWSDTPDKLRVTYRRGVPLTFRSNNLGFRVVAEAPQALVNNNVPRK